MPQESQPRNGHIGDEATRQVDYRDPTVVYSGVCTFMKNDFKCSKLYSPVKDFESFELFLFENWADMQAVLHAGVRLS